MKKHGLPTYPIADGMAIGNREPDEIDSLLENGFFQTNYHKIRKIDDEYVLSENEVPLFGMKEQFIDKWPTLNQLLQEHGLTLDTCRWFSGVDHQRLLSVYRSTIRLLALHLSVMEDCHKQAMAGTASGNMAEIIDGLKELGQECADAKKAIDKLDQMGR